MDNFIVGIIIVATGELATVAYRHPAEFSRMAPAIGLALLVVQGVL
jgi:hypothetical protein